MTPKRKCGQQRETSDEDQMKRLRTICIECGFGSSHLWPFCPKCYSFQGVSHFQPLLVWSSLFGAIALVDLAAAIIIWYSPTHSWRTPSFLLAMLGFVVFVYFTSVAYPNLKNGRARYHKQRREAYRIWQNLPREEDEQNE